MRLRFTAKFTRKYHKASDDIQDQTDKTLQLLLSNPKHPSLRSKIVDETNRIWQARVTRSWRIYYQVEGTRLIIVDLFPHRN